MSIKKAFLSSTGKDLTKYRDAAYKAMEGLDGWHGVRMEDFGARDWEADEFCRAKVAECDVLVGIAGHLYGGIPRGKKQSYTEREYEAAVDSKVPRLMFLAPEDFPVPAKLREATTKWKRQRAFRQRVNAERVRDTFSSPDDLARRVVQAIRNWEQEQADLPTRSETARAVGVLPLPPQPYFAHPYPLQEGFTGRLGERQMLAAWLTADDRPVLGLVAMGGMGKSSVAWVWLQRDVLGFPLPGVAADDSDASRSCRVPETARPEGVLWWSYYEGGGTFAGFLEAAIAYCSGGEKSSADYLTESGPGTRVMDYAAMQTDIIQVAQQHRFLFVWDGAERLLREYGALDASIREERDPEELEPDARDTLAIPVSRFLEQMAGQTSSRLLVVSRLYPRALEKLAGSRWEELNGLDEADAVAYLRARGIQGNRAELATAAAQYEFHPLSLTNLAADLLHDFEEEGDISAALKHDQTENVKARREHILARAYDRRSRHRRELLSRLATMRGTIPNEVVELLAEGIRGLKLENLGRELSELVRHGLLRHPSTGHYDFHPLVRRYCYERPNKKERIHLRLQDYFAAVPTLEEDDVQSVGDLAPVIELYHHTVRAGQYDEASELYRGQLTNILYYRFGAYQTFIELLRALFPDGEDERPRLNEKSDQSLTMHALATCYSLSGQPRRAVPLYETANTMDDELGAKPNLAVGLLAVASVAYLPLGRLADAEESLRASIEAALDVSAGFAEAVGRQELGVALAYRSAFGEAAEELDAAVAYFTEQGQVQSHSVVWAYRTRRALLMGDADDALAAARETRRLADEMARQRFPVERDFVRAEWLVGWSLVELASGSRREPMKMLAEAEGHLTEALRRCRRINMVDHEPDILLAWARWYRASGDAQHALRHAEEALAIADRCEYRLKQADARNFLARLALDDADAKAAKEHAEIAKERAWCDGPPHCYKPALEEAEQLLEEAGSRS